MSKTIDERVVEMKFDNKDFENNVKQSMSTIDKLKAKLNFKGAAQGLESVNSAAKNVNFNNMSNALDSVKLKFNALQVAGVTALANITNSIVNTGRAMLSSFTIQPITDGFQEYETQLNSVQTIMANTASKGTTIDQVTDALNELNTYADKTIYNFSEMTRNIGTFTAAGVDLDKSVASIKGIANLAAMSGSSSAQASTAMYQLSQALAAGRVSLMDWNSVVNAGMGGEQFQNALIRTSEILGTGAEQAIEKYGTFRESLTKGQWLTTEVLTETLKQISGAYTEAELIQQGYSEQQAKDITFMAQNAEDAATKVKTFSQLIDTLKEAVGSGWATTWQTIFGDFYEARDFWTEISQFLGDMVSATSDARNNLLEGAFDSSFDQLGSKIEEAGGSVEDFKDVINQTAKEHGIAVDEMINDETDLVDLIQNGTIDGGIVRESLTKYIDSLLGVSSASEETTESLTKLSEIADKVIMGEFGNGEARMKALADAGYEYATVQDIVNKKLSGQEIAVSDLSDEQLKSVGYTDEQIAALRELGDQATITGSDVDKLIESLTKPSGRELFLGSLKNILYAIINPLQAFKKAWSEVFSIDSSQLYNILAAFNHFTESLIISKETSDKLTRTFKGLFSIISIFTTFAGGAFSAVFKVVQGILDNFDMGILDVTAGIGDAITAFANFVNSNNVVNMALDWLADRITDVIKSFMDFVDVVRDLEIVETIVSKLAEGFSSIRDQASDLFEGLQPYISSFVDLISRLSEMSFEEIVSELQNLGTSLKEYLGSKITGILSTLGNIFNDVLSTISSNLGWTIPLLGDAKDAFVGFISTVVDRVKSVGGGGLVALLFGIGAIATFKSVIGLVSKITSPMEALSEVITGLGGSIQKYIDAKTFIKKSEAVRNLAISVAILAGSVALLASLDPESLQNATYAIVGLAIAVGGLTVLFDKFGGNKTGSSGMSSLVLNIVAIAGSILMVASAFAVMNSLNMDNLIATAVALIAVMGALAGLSIAMDKFGSKGKVEDFGGPAVQILALAVALRIAAGALATLNSLNPDNMVNTIISLIAVVGALGILMYASDKLKVGKGGIGLLAMVVGLQAFIFVLQGIAGLDTSMILSALPNFITIFGMLAIMMAATSVAGANATKAGIGLIAMSAALLITTKAIDILGGMDPSKMQQGVDAIRSIGVIFALLIAVTQYAGANAVKAGASLLIMSAAMLVLTGVIAIMSLIDPSGLARGISAITILGTLFAGLMYVSQYASESYKSIIAMSVVIGVLTAAVAVLSLLDPNALVNTTACLTSLMVAFGIMLAASNLAKSASKDMLAMVGIVAILALIVAGLAAIPAEASLANAAALSMLMISLSAALTIGSFAKGGTTDLAVSMLTLVPALAAVALVVRYIATIPAEASLANVASVAALLTELAGLTVLFGKVSVNVSMAAQGAAALDVVAVIIGALIGIVGLINDATGGGLASTMQSAIPVMQAMGQAIGELIGGLVGGIVSGAGKSMMSMLPAFGSALSMFWLNIQPFVIGTQMMGDGAISGIKTLVEALMLITGADFIENLNRFFQGGGSSSMDTFSVNLTKLASALVTFSTILSVGNFNGDIVTKAANAGKALGEMQNAIQGENGIFQMFTGVKDIGAFGEQLVDFGEAICEFSNTIVANGGIDENAITAAANAGKIMTELQNGLVPNGEGGSVIEFLTGQKNLTNFGNQLKEYGKAICDFSNTVSGEGKINKDAIQAAADAGAIMSSLEEGIDTTDGGVIGWFAGQTNLSNFGTQIKEFGQAMVDFSGIVSGSEEGGGIDSEAVQKAASLGTALSELANGLPTYTFGSGKLDLSGFGTHLTSFAYSIASMATTLSNVDMEKIGTVVTVAQSMSSVLSSLQGIDESVINKFWVLGTLSTSLNEFSSGIQNIDVEKIDVAVTAAKKLSTLITSLSGITNESVSGFTSAVSQLGQVSYSQIQASFDGVDFSLIGNRIMSQISAGIRVGSENVSAQINIAMSSIKTSINGMSGTDFTNAGLRLITQISAGIRSGASNVVTEALSTVKMVISAIDGYGSSFSNIGKNFALGFANGIRSGSYSAVIAARAMANAAAEAAAKALDEHSPSKVMYRIGDYAGLGFVNGLSGYAEKSAEYGARIANSLVESVSMISGAYDQMGDLDKANGIIQELSKSLDDIAEKDEKNEKKQKLAESIGSIADSAQKIVDRKNDLKSIFELFTTKNIDFSTGFMKEMIDSSGAYAGIVSDVVNFTEEQIQALSDIYRNEDLVDLTESFANKMVETMENVSSSGKKLKSVQSILKKTGLTFTNKFVQEVITSGGEYNEYIELMADMTNEQLQRIADTFREADINAQVQTLIDNLVSDKGLAYSFDYSGRSLEEFVKKINDFGLDIEDALSAVTKFADSVSDGFSKMSTKSQTSVQEFTDNLEHNMTVAREWSENVKNVFNKISDYGYSQEFRNEILEGGFEKYGRIINEMAQMSKDQIIDVIETWNSANIYGNALGENFVESVTDMPSFTPYGYEMTTGISKGIEEGTSNVKATMDLLCSTLKNTVTSYFGIHSPSTLMEQIGVYIIQGLSKGIDSTYNQLIDSFPLVQDAIELIRQLGDEGIDIKVTVTPVIDMDSFNEKMSILESEYGSVPSAGTLETVNTLNSLASQNGVNSTAKLEEAVTKLADKVDSIDPDKFGVTYQQNNYSPKALSTATIYRQTRNQISLMRDKSKV